MIFSYVALVLVVLLSCLERNQIEEDTNFFFFFPQDFRAINKIILSCSLAVPKPNTILTTITYEATASL